MHADRETERLYRPSACGRSHDSIDAAHNWSLKRVLSEHQLSINAGRVEAFGEEPYLVGRARQVWRHDGEKPALAGVGRHTWPTPSQTSSANAAAVKPARSSVRPDRTFDAQAGSARRARPMATRSNSSRSRRRSRLSRLGGLRGLAAERAQEVAGEAHRADGDRGRAGQGLGPAGEIEALLAVQFGNSGSQKRRCEQCRTSTPASTRGASQSVINWGVSARRKA